MPLVSDVVRSALDTDLSPDDIVGLAREPERVFTQLRDAYAAIPPDYALPLKGKRGRPYVAYGRESGASSEWRAPTWRARAAVQTLVYSHEVAVEDPVAWYLQHPYAEPHDATRTLELLSAVAELAPLIDKGLVRCMPQQPYRENTSMYSVYDAFAQLLYGPDYTARDWESAGEFLDLLSLRRQTHGQVDVARHPGNYWIFNVLREGCSRLATDTELLAPTEAVVVVPDIARITTQDLVAIRSTTAFDDWLDHLTSARAIYEQALSAGCPVEAAEEAFRDEMAAAAVKVANELDRSSWKSLAIQGSRDAGLGAAGGVLLLQMILREEIGWRELAGAFVAAVGATILGAGKDAGRLRDGMAPLLALRNHFDAFIL